MNKRIVLSLFALLLFAGCVGIPDDVQPVGNFRIERYLGKWYEIARLDHSFERGLSDVSASYTLRPDGGVTVLNRGYDAARESWKSAEGVAYFTGDADRGSLKVSFFRPFYGGYHIVALDADYRWSLVVGPSRDYLWILARERRLPEDVKAMLLDKAASLGFDTGKLIWVGQQRPDA